MAEHHHPRWAREFLTHDDLEAIKQSVVEAESRTSGEIRVHVEPRVPRRRFGRRGDPLERAKEVFAKLGMHRTRERHGVLIYLAVKDRKLAVIGDEGIHVRVTDDYWQSVRDLMVDRLRSGPLSAAIVAAVGEVGRVLAEHFPRRPDDTDELSDEVSLA
jgi:uncharacterized membrane protein